MTRRSHDDVRICREADFELTECLWCGCFTVNAQSDRCECGHELYPVTKMCKPGSRVMGIYLKKNSPLAAYASSLGLLHSARAEGDLTTEEEGRRTAELEDLWEKLDDDSKETAERLTELVKAMAT